MCFNGGMTRIHTFDTSLGSYDLTQTSDDISDGDVLHIPSEGIYGILLAAWPVAISPNKGEFHTWTGRYEDLNPAQQAGIDHIREQGWMENPS